MSLPISVSHNTNSHLFKWLFISCFVTLVFFGCNSKPLPKDSTTLSSNLPQGQVVKDGIDILTANYSDKLLRISYSETITAAKPISLHIYDQSGQLVYLEKDPPIRKEKSMDVDFTYMKDGDYQLMIELADGERYQTWVAVDLNRK